MQLLTKTVLICCTYSCIASQHSDIIPIEGYETKLEDLGQHVETPEIPVKVIKITKTIAVKIPVPYPVKVIEKVPYPVHVNKPYPVPVPQIVKVPHIVNVGKHHEQYEGNYEQNVHKYGEGSPDSYQVQEGHEHDPYSSSGPKTNEKITHEIIKYEGAGLNPHYNFGSASSSSGHPSSSETTYESDAYDQAYKNYISNHSPSSGGGYH